MSAQTKYWERVNRLLKRAKEINPAIDTCPLCWANSGLPSAVFRGDSDTFCSPCQELIRIVKETKKEMSAEAAIKLSYILAGIPEGEG